jgi:hypothetical protein
MLDKCIKNYKRITNSSFSEPMSLCLPSFEQSHRQQRAHSYTDPDCHGTRSIVPLQFHHVFTYPQTYPNTIGFAQTSPNFNRAHPTYKT